MRLQGASIVLAGPPMPERRDGDTVHVVLDLGWYRYLVARRRVKDVDTAQLREPLAPPPSTSTAPS